MRFSYGCHFYDKVGKIPYLGTCSTHGTSVLAMPETCLVDPFGLTTTYNQQGNLTQVYPQPGAATFETPVAKQLGEPTRSVYANGWLVRVAGPLSKKIIKQVEEEKKKTKEEVEDLKKFPK